MSAKTGRRNTALRKVLCDIARDLKTPDHFTGDRICVYCQCTQSRACVGGCYWIVEHSGTNTGVCSNTRCVHQLTSDTLDAILKFTGKSDPKTKTH